MTKTEWVLAGLIALFGAVEFGKRLEGTHNSQKPATHTYGFGIAYKNKEVTDLTKVGIFEVDHIDCASSAPDMGLRVGDVIFHAEIRDEQGNRVNGVFLDKPVAQARPLTAHVVAFRTTLVGTRRINATLKLLPLSGKKC